MRKNVVLYLTLPILLFCTSTALAVEHELYGFQTHYPDYHRRLLAADSPHLEFSGRTPPYFNKLATAMVNGDALARAVKEVTNLPIASIKYVPYDEWTVERTNPDDVLFLTIEPVSQMIFDGGGGLGDSECLLGFTIRSQRSLDASKAKAIAKRYIELVAPDVKKLSEQLFNEKFEPAIAEANKKSEAATGKVDGLDAQRRGLQLRSYEELPYEKVADHLADLQRQILAIALSLAGMDAKQQEIDRQKAMAEERLKDQASRAAKEAASNETVDAIKQLVALREKNVERLRELNKSGMATAQSEIDDATAKVLETKIQLFALQGKKQLPVQNEQLETLQSELTRLAIDRAEQKAKLEFLAKTRDDVQQRIANRADLDQDIKRIDEQLPSAKTALRKAQSRVKELEDAKAVFKPLDLTKDD
jgi:hypothetical protein